MRKKILKYMNLIIGIALTCAYIITIFLVYWEVRGIVEDNLKNEAKYIADAVEISGVEYLEFVDIDNSKTRITLIDADGNVLFDSEEDESTMQNHSDRTEFIDAVNEGEGLDVRKSSTVGMNMMYYALLLSDGNVIRVSQSMRSVLFTALQILPFMLAILVIVLVAAGWFITRQTKKLMEPINSIDLNEPLENDVYDEIHPLLERIDEQNRQKDAMADMRKEFSANVSHELKTPLTSISGYAEIMRNGLIKGEDVSRFAGKIYKEARRLIALVEDIINLSRLDEGKIMEEKTMVDLFDLAKNTVESLMPKARENGVHVYLTGERCYVYGVSSLLGEMAYNLVENAIKYNRKDGEVIIWAGEDIDSIRLKVSDTGIGIPKDSIERVFERFYRVDKSRSKETGGTGLGLSIVKHGAEIHNARIDIKSELNVGTAIEIVFPKNNALEAKEEPAPEETEKNISG